MPKYFVKYTFNSEFVKEITAPSLEAAKAVVNRRITLTDKEYVDSTHLDTSIYDAEGIIVE